MKIITLTLNPAFDIHAETDRFETGRESFFEILSKDAGGKGINLSRALLSAGVDSRAVVCVGKENGREFVDKIRRSGLSFNAFFRDGRIRENYILHDKTGAETRVSFNGDGAPQDLFLRAAKAVGKLSTGDIVALTGSLPKGADADEAKAFLKAFKDEGAKIILDCRSFSLEDVLSLSPFLIKPNRDEISALCGRELQTREDIRVAARSLSEKGIENVLVSLGPEGAVLACREGVFEAFPPRVRALSTIGAGDSMTAGFIYAYLKGEKGEGLLKYAVAFGTAACLREGTLPPEMKDVERIYAAL